MKDGLGGFTLDYDHKLTIARKVDKYNEVIQRLFGVQKIQQSFMVGLHGRQATTGQITHKNVHFFQHGDYIFAHNGIVSSFTTFLHGANHNDTIWKNGRIVEKTETEKEKEKEAEEAKVKAEEMELNEWTELQTVLFDCPQCDSVKSAWCKNHEGMGYRFEILDELNTYPYKEGIESEPDRLADDPPVTGYLTTSKELEVCDSLRFLRCLPQHNITLKRLAKAVDIKNFAGVGFLYDTVNKRGIIFGSRSIEVQTDMKNYMFLYSYTPEKNMKEYQNYMGLSFVEEQEETMNTIKLTKRQARIDGIFVYMLYIIYMCICVYIYLVSSYYYILNYFLYNIK
ncbi:MAG: class II glutamine amidotransferase [Thaumarchaeota archaeon]|nr:class II glutamine amidotransferase [Nitrososphaerota archaeon]